MKYIKKLYKKDNKERIRIPPNTLIAANGEEIPVYKYTQITVILSEIYINTWVYVIEDLGYQLLLGIQFLRKINAQWDFNNNKLKITDPKAQTTKEETEIDIIRINNEENVVNKINIRPTLFITKIKKNKWIMPNCIQTLDLNLHGYKINKYSY